LCATQFQPRDNDHQRIGHTLAIDFLKSVVFRSTSKGAQSNGFDQINPPSISQTKRRKQLGLYIVYIHVRVHVSRYRGASWETDVPTCLPVSQIKVFVRYSTHIVPLHSHTHTHTLTLCDCGWWWCSIRNICDHMNLTNAVFDIVGLFLQWNLSEGVDKIGFLCYSDKSRVQ
jgi:hypothetical protein